MEYHLLTIWRIEAPLEKVFAAVQDSLHWPEWWPSVRKVEQLATGRTDGIDSVWSYSWQGQLPYRVRFEVCATRIEKLVAIEGTTRGDLEGSGCWHFSRLGAVSVVRCEWHVRSTRWWMNLFAPVARALFVRNHAQVMAQGGESLARLLSSALVSQETIDLMAVAIPPPDTVQSRLRERGRAALSLVLLTGISAGVLATVVQLVLWWLTDTPLVETFLRDVRLTAALIMGSDVLPPPLTPRWDILLVATLIHFALSVAYAVLASYWCSRLKSLPTLLAGALYGLAIYGVNLYGLTVLFPWFSVTRDWVTLAAHLVFGVVLLGGCRRLAA